MRLTKANDVVTSAMKQPQKTIFWPESVASATVGSAITSVLREKSWNMGGEGQESDCRRATAKAT
jgi:hypothetical protein